MLMLIFIPRGACKLLRNCPIQVVAGGIFYKRIAPLQNRIIPLQLLETNLQKVVYILDPCYLTQYL